MTEEQRSYCMSRIRGRDTSIERILSRSLWHRGLRFRKNSKAVYGHPDISIRKYRIAIFCDGDFWHGYDWENRKDSVNDLQDKPEGLDMSVLSTDSVSGLPVAPHPYG